MKKMRDERKNKGLLLPEIKPRALWLHAGMHLNHSATRTTPYFNIFSGDVSPSEDVPGRFPAFPIKRAWTCSFVEQAFSITLLFQVLIVLQMQL